MHTTRSYSTHLLQRQPLSLHFLADEAHVGPRLQGALEGDVGRSPAHEADEVVVLLGRQGVQLDVSDLLAECRSFVRSIDLSMQTARTRGKRESSRDRRGRALRIKKRGQRDEAEAEGGGSGRIAECEGNA